MSFTLFFACTPQQDQLSIPAEQLLKIIKDVHIAEAAMTGLGTERKDSVARVYYEQIFTIHGVTEADFYHDLELLKSRPEQLAKAYGVLQQQMESEK
ncbi:MAG: DUF4296 domain-containing protein [Saprospiraceae bacterium]